MPFLTDEQLAKLTPNQLAELLALVRVWKKKIAAAEGLGCMPASAVKAMTDVVDDRLMASIVQDNRKGVAEPSGLAGPGETKGPLERGSGWQSTRPLESPPGVKHVDRIAEHFAALDKLETLKRFSGK